MQQKARNLAAENTEFTEKSADRFLFSSVVSVISVANRF
ncbi:MAG: hypothetical protein AWT59_1425 [Candidatus Gallionella acididurans]|uniref:Uncharacterized protein n=1 Tax=Candidatus Gallionella acididurans TaxID=1796491 RepID=A0A139BUK7_9PROT|nr:MAG: hypothetical protein AWT59_1425 [Candidatus Gallionella acididurans]